MKKQVIASLELLTKYIENINLGVSIDGDEQTHNKIRGINCYQKAIELVKEVKRLFPTVNVSISLTINHMNCNIFSLQHIKKVSEELMCDFSFRLANVNRSYYHNEEKDFKFEDEMKRILVEFIIENKIDDKYMREQLYFLLTGRVPLMYDYQNKKLLCQAGKKFVFIHSNGDIFPCINSNKKIGDYKNGITGVENELMEHCPCMTECTIWPMLTCE